MSQGKYAEAVTVLIEVLESLTYHFVEDEHYNFFDDMYSPDYVCQYIMETVIDAIKNGNFFRCGVTAIERWIGEVETYGSIRRLRCAVCFECVEEI